MSLTDWQLGAEDVMASRNLVELGLAEFFQKLENSLVLSAKMYSSSLKVYLLDLKQGERIACLQNQTSLVSQRSMLQPCRSSPSPCLTFIIAPKN